MLKGSWGPHGCAGTQADAPAQVQQPHDSGAPSEAPSGHKSGASPGPAMQPTREPFDAHKHVDAEFPVGYQEVQTVAEMVAIIKQTQKTTPEASVGRGTWRRDLGREGRGARGCTSSAVTCVPQC